MVEDWIEFWFRKAPDESVIIEAIKILWGIWVRRNKAAFDNYIIDPLSTITMINNLRVDNFLDMNFQIDDQRVIRCDLNYFVISNVNSWCVDPTLAEFLVDGAWKQERKQATAAWVVVNRNGWQVASRAFSFQA